jgi:hypothetical protein
MSYRSKQFRKDNPRWVISNAAETTKVASAASPLLTTVVTAWDQPGEDPATIGERARGLGGVALSWLIGLPRRAGARLFARNDEEAGWHGWQVTETFGGLGRRYRDARFTALKTDPTLRSDALRDPTRLPKPVHPADGWDDVHGWFWNGES